jgi:hypothetical protein
MMRAIARAQSAEVIRLPPEDSEPDRIPSNGPPRPRFRLPGCIDVLSFMSPLPPNLLSGQRNRNLCARKLPLTRKLMIARIFSTKTAGTSERRPGTRGARGPHYEREFTWSEWLFRAREIHLPQGPVAKTFLCLQDFFLLENKGQFRGREIPEKNGRRFNQITVVWTRRKQTG